MNDKHLQMLAEAFIERAKIKSQISELMQSDTFKEYNRLIDLDKKYSTVRIEVGKYHTELGVWKGTIRFIKEGYNELSPKIQKDLKKWGIIDDTKL